MTLDNIKELAIEYVTLEDGNDRKQAIKSLIRIYAVEKLFNNAVAELEFYKYF